MSPVNDRHASAYPLVTSDAGVPLRVEVVVFFVRDFERRRARSLRAPRRRVKVRTFREIDDNRDAHERDENDRRDRHNGIRGPEMTNCPVEFVLEVGVADVGDDADAVAFLFGASSENGDRAILEKASAPEIESVDCHCAAGVVPVATMIDKSPSSWNSGSVNSTARAENV